jgi:hypothetical protein
MPIVMGPPAFITLSNIRTSSTNNTFTVVFDTDQPVLMAMDYWSYNDPTFTTPGSVLEGVLGTHHTISTGAIAPVVNRAGKVFGFSLRLDAADVSGKTLRSQQAFVQLVGARLQAGQQLPVRFNMYGDGTRPAGGGGNGNWSSYTWAQWNPKMTAFPTP